MPDADGKRGVRTVVASPATHYLRNGAAATMRGLNGSASPTGSQLTLTVTNPSLDQTREAEIGLHGGTPHSVAAVTLAAADPHSHNTFEAPRAVEPKAFNMTIRGSGVVHPFPPASVTKADHRAGIG